MAIGNDATKKALAVLDAMRAHDDLARLLQKQVIPAAEVSRLFQERSSAIQRVIDGINRNHELMQAAIGPMEQLRRSGFLDTFGIAAECARQSFAQFNANFHLPKIEEARRFVMEIERSGALSAVQEYQRHAADIQLAVDAMRTPWLDMQDKVQSMVGFAELQGIGLSLKHFHAFDERFVDSLRIELGDWRHPINWPDQVLADPFARSAFYVERGLDARLTNFPAAAFEQSMAIAGLRADAPLAVEAYRSERAEQLDEEEVGFERTNLAHDRLLRFETHMRRFVDEKMQAAFGDQWVKRRVSSDTYQKWHRKRQAARDRGDSDCPLIAYADFMDYEQIIIRSDNWNQIFKPVFRRQEFVTESFQRLHPIRLCTMHARIITQDDELYLYVEVKRLLAAIGISI